MKRLTLLLVLMLSAGLGGKSNAFADQATAAGAPRVRPAAQAPYEYSTEHQIDAPNKNHKTYHTDEMRLVRAGPINEVEVKRLKLIFLLMVSLGQYRTPVH